jgi:endonuclease YncB( thermonuclease family)
MISATKIYWVVVITLFGFSIFFLVRTEQFRKSIPKGSGKNCLQVDQPATVKRVIDGDEIVVEQGKCMVNVRLLGIKSFHPVRSELPLQPLGTASMGYLKRYLGERITVLTKEKKLDPRGRTLARLSADGKDIGLRMVGKGLVVVYRKFPFQGEALYIAAEEKARAVNRGLWAVPKAVTRVQFWQIHWAKERPQ